MSSLSRIITIISIIIIIISLYFIMIGTVPSKKLAGEGSLINKSHNPDIGGHFKLIDHNNKVFTHENLKGQISLIYFGFSCCPDICIESLKKLAEVTDILGKYNIQITPIFITVDPKRDKPNILKEYILNYSPNIIGLTGSDENIKDTAKKFKVFYSALKEPNEEDYLVDHTALVYLFGRDGNYHHHFFYGVSVKEMVDYIRLNKDSL